MTEYEAGLDDIDRIVEALLENPERAGDIKSMLRSKMMAPEVVHMVAPAPSADVAADDTDDLWDNVPL